MNLFKYKSAGSYRSRAGRKRRKSLRNKVGIYKVGALSVGGKESLGKCCFARPIRPGDYIDISIFHKISISL